MTGAGNAHAAVAVIGIGSDLSGDDEVGLEVVRRVRARGAAGVAAHELRGDLTELLDLWRGCDAAVLVDAMRSGAAVGSVRRLDLCRDSLPPGLGSLASSHAISLVEAIELARALGQMPSRAILYAVEGGRLQRGARMSRPVRAVIPDLADAVLREASVLARRGAGYVRSSDEAAEVSPPAASI